MGEVVDKVKELTTRLDKGEKGIQIFAPCPYKVKKETEFTNEKGEKESRIEEILIPKFKVVNVFDVSQTSGEPLKQIAEELTGEYKNFSKLKDISFFYFCIKTHCFQGMKLY